MKKIIDMNNTPDLSACLPKGYAEALLNVNDYIPPYNVNDKEFIMDWNKLLNNK